MISFALKNGGIVLDNLAQNLSHWLEAKKETKSLVPDTMAARMCGGLLAHRPRSIAKATEAKLPQNMAHHCGEAASRRACFASGQIQEAFKKLAAHLIHEEQPYVLTGHQFRHTLATDMIEQGVDIYTVKEFLGHKSL